MFGAHTNVRAQHALLLPPTGREHLFDCEQKKKKLLWLSFSAALTSCMFATIKKVRFNLAFFESIKLRSASSVVRTSATLYDRTGSVEIFSVRCSCAFRRFRSASWTVWAPFHVRCFRCASGRFLFWRPVEPRSKSGR